MANAINWGKIYCSSEFGDIQANTVTIPLASAPSCWAGELVLSADDTGFFADSTTLTADATEE